MDRIKQIKLRTKFGKTQKHWYHMVTVSPWPFIGSLGALSLTVSAVMYFHGYMYSGFLLINALLIVVTTMYMWWRDIIRESTFGGYHTKAVVSGLRIGMLLFITSEIMFFFSFFWAFFHSSLAPGIAVGCIWPPIGIQALAPMHIPLLNTLILLTSGITITLSHYSLCAFKEYYWPFNDKTDYVVDSIKKLLPVCYVYDIYILPTFLWGLGVEKPKNKIKTVLEYHIDDVGDCAYRRVPVMTDKGKYIKEEYIPWSDNELYKNFHDRWENFYGSKLKFFQTQDKVNSIDDIVLKDRFFFWWLILLYFPRVNELSVISLCITIFLAIEFTLWQFFEYLDALFYISDGVYGSTFYMTTGFHGLHVIIGTFFLIICLFRMIEGHFRFDHHFGFEAAIWYWHFVDVVWLFLFLWVYVWSYGF